MNPKSVVSGRYILEGIDEYTLSLGPRRVSSAAKWVSQVTADKHSYQCLTVFVSHPRFVYYILIIKIQCEFELMHLQLKRIDCGNEEVVLRWWARSPVLAQIGEHVDVVTE